ncbi:MAG TPA: hypothetical protein VLQ90_05045 [Pyrinomonadaceae bacterium]|nr:hypothetical protein [Pyrinomonadaceae bacterium]
MNYAQRQTFSMWETLDRALQYLPFAALPSPIPTIENTQTTREAYRPLIADYEITIFRPLQSSACCDEKWRAESLHQKRSLVLADPVSSKTGERVRAAKRGFKPGDQRAKSHQAVRGVDALESELVRAVRDVGGENGLEIDRLPFTR